MARGDVFPPRIALPGAAVNWGRHVEERIEGTEDDVTRVEQSLQGLNRSTASSLGDLGAQIVTLGNQQTQLSNQQTELANQQQTLANQQTQLGNQQTELQNQQQALAATQAELTSVPLSITKGYSHGMSNPGFSSTNWTMVGFALFTMPANKSWANFFLNSQVVLKDISAGKNATLLSRIKVSYTHRDGQSLVSYAPRENGVANVRMQDTNYLMTVFSGFTSVQPRAGTTIRVDLELKPSSTAAFNNPGASENFLYLTVNGSFEAA